MLFRSGGTSFVGGLVLGLMIMYVGLQTRQPSTGEPWLEQREFAPATAKDCPPQVPCPPSQGCPACDSKVVEKIVERVVYLPSPAQDHPAKVAARNVPSEHYQPPVPPPPPAQQLRQVQPPLQVAARIQEIPIDAKQLGAAVASNSAPRASENAPASTDLIPVIPKPYQCKQPGNVVKVALRKAFLTADTLPIQWTMHVHPAREDRWVSATIYENEGNDMFEMHVKSRIYQCLRATDGSYPRPNNPLFLDVGANIGIHSLFTAALKVRTHSFEPMPKNLNVLVCSAASNPGMSDYITINGFGLSDKANDGGCMNVAANNQGDAFFETNGVKCPINAIRLRRLDDYWNNVLHREHVFAMKMDVQGFEGFVIRGGAEMFRTKPPVFFLMEFSPARYRTYGIDGAQILKDLIGYGYSIQLFDGSDVTLESGRIDKLAATSYEYDLKMTHDGMLNKYRRSEITF